MLARTHVRMFAAIATVAITLSFLSSPVQARGPAIIIALSVPNQTVDQIAGRDGQDVGPGVFEAKLHGYDNGLAKGQAMLRLENSRFDFYFHTHKGEITTTIGIDLEGRGQRTDERGRTHRFTFNATVQPHYDHDGGTTDTPDCFIWDIDGANLTDRERFTLHFEAEGILRVR